MTNCIHDHGRWGKGNQLGASHFLTPARTLAALRRVETGRIVDLSHTIEVGAPNTMLANRATPLSCSAASSGPRETTSPTVICMNAMSTPPMRANPNAPQNGE